MYPTHKKYSHMLSVIKWLSFSFRDAYISYLFARKQIFSK